MALNDDRHVLLVGLMGSGKSSVGSLLARRVGRPFHDLDRDIVADAGLSIPDIFASEGEPGFRTREHRALVAALSTPAPCVIATGGGAVLSLENRLLMRTEGWVIWLQCDPAVLARRVGSGAGRPLLERDPIEVLTTMAADRAAAYGSAAHAAIDVTDLDHDAVVDLVVAAVRDLAHDGRTGTADGARS